MGNSLRSRDASNKLLSSDLTATQLFAIAVRAYSNKATEGHIPSEEPMFGYILQCVAKNIAHQIGDAAHPLENSPGFITLLGENEVIHSPFHLAPFLSRCDIDLLANMARSIRVSKESYICISGSSALGISNPADIDYCEYTPLTGNQIPETFAKTRRSSLPKSLYRVKHADIGVNAPFKHRTDLYICPTYDGSVEDFCKCSDESWMLKFLHRDSNLTIPVSNKVVPTKSAALNYSFAYQEATVGQSRTRSLSRPVLFVEYVQWLDIEIDKNCQSGKYLKAVKRALSLAIILYLEDEANEILCFLDSKAASRLTKLACIEELEGELEHLPPALHRQVNGYIEKEGSVVFADEDTVSFETMRAICERVRCAYRDALEDVGEWVRV